MIILAGNFVPTKFVCPGTSAPRLGVDVIIENDVLRAIRPTVPGETIFVADGKMKFTLSSRLTVDVRLDSGTVLEAKNDALFEPYCTFLTSGQYEIKDRYP